MAQTPTILDHQRVKLNPEKVDKVVQYWDQVLADYHVYYMNIRGFHWNVQGQKFFQLHEFFEEAYNEVAENIDEVAERIQALGSVPSHTMEDFIETSNIESAKLYTDDRECMQRMLKDSQDLLVDMRAAVEVADDAGDEGSLDLLGSLIENLEKRMWMIDAWLR